MKYKYIYKTKDGVRTEATIEAASRNAVFAALRKQGIRPIKVLAADGSLDNGAVNGVRKRVVLCFVLGALCLGGVVAFVVGRGSMTPPEPGVPIAAKPLTRQFINGDRERLAELSTNCFKTAAEAFLARYAEPGKPVVASQAEWPTRAEIDAVLKTPITYTDDEPTEVVYLKRITEGIKRELAYYLQHGGYLSGYYKELAERQRTEAEKRETALKKLEAIKVEKDAYAYWLKANAHLESFGIEPIELPRRLLNYQTLHGLDE